MSQLFHPIFIASLCCGLALACFSVCIMTFTVYVNVLPHPEILDPQGKATLNGLHHMEFSAIRQVRVGKRILLTVEAPNPEAASQQAQQAAHKLLANPITEVFELEQPQLVG